MKPPKSYIKAIIFDIDDTLFDRHKAQELVLLVIVKELPDVFKNLELEAITQAFHESDRISEEEFYVGSLKETDYRSRRSTLFLQLLNLDTRWKNVITELYVTHYPSMNAPIKGANSLITTLAGKFQLSIISNGFREVQYRKLEALEIKTYFQPIILSEELGIRKPDPAIFLRTTSLLQVWAQECLYVGDSFEKDMIGAANAGMISCWYNPKGLSQPDESKAPDLEIRHLEELLSRMEILQTI